MMKRCIPDAIIRYDVFGDVQESRVRDCRTEELAETIYLAP
jgi:hypothetical protein